MLWQYNPSDIEDSLSDGAKSAFPSIDDRHAWRNVRERLGAADVEQMIERAENAALTPVPALPATLFLEFQRTGEREGYQRPQTARRDALAALVFAECLEDHGRFLDPILDYAWAICEESAWVMPAHQSILTDIKRPYVDLGAAGTALTLAECDHLVGSRLDPMLAKRVRDEVNRRCFVPFLTRHDFWWMNNTARKQVNNWTAVCVGGILGAATYLEDDNVRLADIIARGARSLTDYLATFDEDGGSSEGPGYWSYGFGHFTIVAHLVENRTGGQVRFLDGELIQKIARYPLRTLLSPGHYLNFSDCDRTVGLLGPHLTYLARRLDIPELLSLEARQPPNRLERDLAWGLRGMFWWPQSAPTELTLSRDDVFRGMQWLIARFDPTNPDALVLAAKGGHNDEMHNQNDVGNLIVHVKGESLVADLGRGRYTRAYFGPERYEFLVNSSRGHSVPVVNSEFQATGRDHGAVLLGREVSDRVSAMSLELKGAYPSSADLASLKRTVALQREGGTGTVTLSDQVRFGSNPGRFESVLTTFSPVTVEGGLVTILGERARLQIECDSSVVSPRVEKIPDVDLADGPTTVNRMIFELIEPSREATVELRMRPI